MLTTGKRDLLRGVLQVGVFAAVVWYSLPNRPALTPYAWRTAARGAQALADHATHWALFARTHYWKAIRT